jgi:hypothetical protein
MTMFITGNFDGFLSCGDFGPHEGKTIEARRFEVYDSYTPNVIRTLYDPTPNVGGYDKGLWMRRAPGTLTANGFRRGCVAVPNGKPCGNWAEEHSEFCRLH